VLANSLRVTWLGLATVTTVLSGAASAAAPGVGHIVGRIDGISQDGEQYFVSGFACQQGQKASILVHVFADDGKHSFVIAGKANLESDGSIGQACQDRQGGKHRFFISLPAGHGQERSLFVDGIRIVDGVANDAIAGSGTPLARLPGVEVPGPALPPLQGSYRGLAAHPRVFTTGTELKELASRINRPGSYSMQRFDQLAGQIARDLAARNDWDATYGGCNFGAYQYAFSYEPQDGHEAATHALLNLAPGTLAPAGAAVVASRLALYAALIKAGAAPPAGAPSADRAVALAKRILLAWADRGFKDLNGRFRSPSQTCDEAGKIALAHAGGIPLVLGRGVVYSVHAQDLLQSIGAVDAGEASRLDAFHAGLFELIRQSYNVRFGQPYPLCERYSNHAANGVAGLLAIARLLDDRGKFDAVLRGGDKAIPVVLPWTRFFDHAIYGTADRPIDCYDNPGPDSLTSDPSFDTPDVAPGEVEDRYRNHGPLQGIGYSMFTLQRLIDTAEILRGAGFDAYGYRGRHGQSIEAAIDYYACLAQHAGFSEIVTAANAGGCPNAAQYYGKLVNAVDQRVLIGADRFPQDEAITRVEAAAKVAATSGAFPLDAILFGKWRD
jgi:hypothetical protein